MDRQDPVGEFLRKISKDVGLRGAGSNLVCLTASGKILHKKGDPYAGMRMWNVLPAEETKPGAITLPADIKVDTASDIRRPPKGALVIKQYYRLMAYTPEKELRYVTAKDFVTPIGNNQSTRLKPAYYTAQPDYIWLKEAEWKAMIPKQPRSGQSFAVPAAISERIFRYHLNPYMVRAESNGLRREHYSNGNLTLTVRSVTDSTITMQLKGSVQIGQSFESAQSRKEWGYSPRLTGVLTVDRKKGEFAQFDVVALGDFHGKIGRNDPFYRAGQHPLGIAFELVDAQVPRNQVAPRGVYRTNFKNYFGTGR